MQNWNTWSVFYSSDYMGDPSLRPRLVINEASNPGVGQGVPPAAPVPEPETYAMLLAGLGLLGFAGRHKRNPAA